MYQMREAGFRERLLEDVSGVGGSLMRARSAGIRTLTLRVAPLAEQRRIVTRIETLFARTRRARADLKRIMALVTIFRERVLAAALRGDLTDDFRSSHNLRSPGETLSLIRKTRQKEALEPRRAAALQSLPPIPGDLPGLPAEWTWACVEELASDAPRSIQSGPFGSSLLHSEFTKEGRLVIGIDNVQDGFFSPGSQNRIPDEKFSDLVRFEARPRDVLITVMATVGRCCVVPDDIERAIITKHVYRITVEPRLTDPHYLMNTLRGSEAVLTQMGANIRGQTRPGINGEILKALYVPLPSLEEQQEVVARVDMAMASITKTEKDARRVIALLDHLEQTILTKAFRGELVPQDPADEPAEALLARLERPESSMRRRRARETAPA
jgi:type I restriction enzyme S subunit